MPIKGILLIILAAAFVGGYYHREINEWLADFSRENEEENKNG